MAIKQANKRIRKGDKVVVISGNDKGRTGEVLTRRGDRVLVKGVNVRKKAVRKSEVNPQGGLIDLEVPIHASKVMLCHGENAGVRLRIREAGKDGRQVTYRVDGTEQVYRKVKQQKK